MSCKNLHWEKNLKRVYIYIPKPEVRGGGQEEQPHIQGVVAALAQEGLEELFYVQGQERWL